MEPSPGILCERLHPLLRVLFPEVYDAEERSNSVSNSISSGKYNRTFYLSLG